MVAIDIYSRRNRNTEFLKEFVVLAETKNFGEISERLYMNQSTLSKHINLLKMNAEWNYLPEQPAVLNLHHTDRPFCLMPEL